jgi:hypothetical protein
MKHPLTFLTALLLAPLSVLFATDAPKPESPVPGAAVYAPHPHFRWQREADVKIDEVHRIEIARDEAFAEVVCDDRLEVVSRFVPVKALSPGKYWWRVRRGDGEWSQAVAFEVRAANMVFTIRAGSDAETVARVLQDAAACGPARVDFEHGDYALELKEGGSLVTMTGARDLIIDGHGAHLVLGGTFLTLSDCQRVTVQHFTLTPSRPGHTLVRVVAKDPEAMTLTVKPEPGYATDVMSYFQFPGTAGSFLGCMDPVYHGKYLVGSVISARNTRCLPARDAPGAFVFNPVKEETLQQIKIGAVAVVTAYRWHWLKTTRTEECTFTDLTLVGMPGALCAGGGNDTAKSFLGCKIKRRHEREYFGGHSHTGSGRVGEWIEGCEFECLADDGPAQQSFRYAIRGTDGSDAVLLGGNYVQAGERVALVNADNRRGVATVARTVQGTRVQPDHPIAELAAAVGQDANRGWKNVFLYCDAQSNEDFVYRHNRQIGGRAHGVKFNGIRAWIADNHFENINGNAVLAGYISEVSGHGARDVVVSGNTLLRCRWTPIEVWSTSGLGGDIFLWDNRITEAREAAIAIKGGEVVSIVGNAFASTAPPKQGAWIVAQDAKALHASGNTHANEVPLVKHAAPSQQNGKR